MTKSILTPEGDLINYDNLISVSVEVRSVGVDVVAMGANKKPDVAA